jgi:cystathionine beta-lyase/cystathionine gamma-synthase
MLEGRLAAIEGAEDATLFATGMAAVTAVMLQFLSAGTRLVVSDSSYAGTAEIVRGTLRRFDVDVVPVDTADLAAVEEAVDGTTALVFVESPSNPLTKLADIAALAEIAHRAGALLVADSTFATPLITRPLQLGADLVLHSLSKFLGGHGDALGGALLGRAELVDRVRQDVGIRLGGSISPFDAWLILRGLETLPLRIDAHVANAVALAAVLDEHPVVTRVLYPGLASHPQHELATRQMANGGPMLAFGVNSPEAFGAALAEIEGPFTYATSLGLTRSVVLWCDTAELQDSTYQLPPAQLASYREWAGDGVFRLSPGVEDTADLIEHLVALLDRCRNV